MKDKTVLVVAKNHMRSGILAGLIAGLAFGAMMGMMGMLPMVAMIVGSKSSVVGALVHLIFSALIGFGFGYIFGNIASKNKARSIMLGAVYGVVWWILGPLLIMPAILGMGSQLSFVGAQGALPSLWGHIVYGLILGAVYSTITHKDNTTHEN